MPGELLGKWKPGTGRATIKRKALYTKALGSWPLLCENQDQVIDKTTAGKNRTKTPFPAWLRTRDGMQDYQCLTFPDRLWAAGLFPWKRQIIIHSTTMSLHIGTSHEDICYRFKAYHQPPQNFKGTTQPSSMDNSGTSSQLTFGRGPCALR